MAIIEIQRLLNLLMVVLSHSQYAHSSSMPKINSIHSYYLVSIPNTGLYDSRTTWPSTSELQCAMKCSFEIDCKSFLWDSKNGDCNIGIHWPVQNVTQLTSTGERQLYSRMQNCRYDLGYELRSYGQHIRCIFMSPRPVPYNHQCKDIGGRLYKANSLDLISLVHEMAVRRGLKEDNWIFIGLNDVQNEGIFVWVDGKEMTSSESRELFGFGEPNNDYNEDCVGIYVGDTYNNLVDIPCHYLVHYVCEMEIAD